jgi:hypothetical protein
MRVLASLLSVALFEPAAVEPSPRISLSWNAPSECMDREQALARLRELYPELPDEIPDEHGAVAVTVELAETTATVHFVSPRGTDHRTLQAQSCELLAQAVVMVIAVGVEAEADAEVPPPAPEPEEPVAPEETEPPPEIPLLVAVDPPVDDPPPEPRVRGHLGVLGGGGYGPLDTGMGALVLELGVHGRRWRASARGIWIPPRTIAVAENPTLIGRYDGGFGGARACFVSPFVQGRLELPICAGIEAGVLRGRGVGTTPTPTSATQPWAAVGLGPGVRYVANRWIALNLEVDLVAALLRGGFEIGDLVAQIQAPVGVRALAGLEVRFP